MSYTVEISRVTYLPTEDGDREILADHGSVTDTYDAEYDDDMTPVEWAIDRIKRTDAYHPSCWPIGDSLFEHAWLSGTYDHPYTTEVEETSARITGDYTDAERAEIFKAVSVI